MELVGAFRRPAGNAALSQPCRRQVRPAPRHPVPQPGHRRHLGRGHPQLEHDAAGRQPIPRALPDHRDRSALRADHAADRGRGHVQGPVVPHRAMAARAGRLHRQAGGGDRHRRHRRADHPDHRRQRRPPHRVPAHAELVRAAAQRQDRRRDAEQDQGRLSRDVQALPGNLRLLHPYARIRAGLSRYPTRSAKPSSRSSMPSAASASGRAISATS